MKKYLFTVLASLFLLSAQAQEADSVTWERSGSLGFNFANVGLSDRWAGGGESSIALGTVFNTVFVRKSANSTWKSSIDFALGGAAVGGNDFRKTDDAIILLSQYSKTINENWGWGLTGILRTQLLEGLAFTEENGMEVSNRISTLMAPGYLTLNLGIDFIKGDVFSLSMSPAAGKFTFVLDDELSSVGAFGVDIDKKVRTEFGSNVLAILKLKVMENITFQSTLNFFTAYDTFGNVDTNWETLLVMKVNKWFNATFGTQLIYDDDIVFTLEDGRTTREIQFKHVLNFGLNFALFSSNN